MTLLLALALAVTPQTFDTCDPKTPDKSADQVAFCLGQLRDQADAALNQVYARAMASLSPGERVKLRDAQRAWLAFRAKDQASLTGSWRAARGTRARIEAARADVTAIVARTRQLQAYLTESAP